MNKYSIDKENPGIIRVSRKDSMAGYLIGIDAEKVCEMLNSYESFRQQNEKLRGALDRILNQSWKKPKAHEKVIELIGIAREALKEPK